jgi:N utilization substance protein A
VPDNQLSLAIGKKGQNARLAAKLTGLRIDVKSETELDDERRRHEDERARGLAGLAELPPVSPHQAQVLATRGFDSPAKVKAAGAAALREIEGIGDEAEAIVAAAGEWLAARQAEAAARPMLLEDPAGPPVAEAPAPEDEAR